MSLSDHTLAESGVLSALTAEYDRAKVKHGENTLDGGRSNDFLRFAALVEEVGEVAHLLTYDQAETFEDADLKKELIQVANVAITWASIL